MNYVQRQQQRKAQRITRVRAKLFGTADRPRLSVYRSNQHVMVQAIDDERGVTVAASSDLGKAKQGTGTKLERTVAAAKAVAQALKKAKVTKVSFDRGPYKYHGRVKAVAETLREEGIEV